MRERDTIFQQTSHSIYLYRAETTAAATNENKSSSGATLPTVHLFELSPPTESATPSELAACVRARKPNAPPLPAKLTVNFEAEGN